MGAFDFLKRLNPLRQTPSSGAAFERVMQVSLDPCRDPLYATSLVASGLSWFVNNCASCSLETWRDVAGADQDELIERSDAHKAWDFGDIYGGRDLVEAGMLLSLVTDGTSFIRPLKSGLGKVVGYQYLPHFDCQFWDGDNVLYTSPSGDQYLFPRSELIINRLGVDPTDLRRGYAPLKACFTEVMTDQEAAQFSRVVLRNFGVIGGIVGPKPSKEGIINGDLSDFQVKNIRRLFSQTDGENRGRLIVSPVPIEYQQITATPEQMVLEKVRRIPEERIAAALGIPAVVLGFGAGLDKSTYNNVRDARKAAWTNALIPLQDRIARQWNRQMLPLFEVDESLYLGWDRKHVEALREDQDAIADRYARLFLADVVTRDEARSAIDMPPSGLDGYHSDLTGGAFALGEKSRLRKRLEARGNVFDG